MGTTRAESLAGVLAQCTALVLLGLEDNEIGSAGAESLAGVLAQCPALAGLDHCFKEAEGMAGVLGQRLVLNFGCDCTACVPALVPVLE